MLFKRRAMIEIDCGSRNRLAHSYLVSMRTFETTDSKVARCCRHDRHRRRKTIVKIEGLLVTRSHIEVCCESI
jgi:hypothetical protein